MNHDWVFAGSIVIKDPENGREYLRGQQRRHHQHLELPLLDCSKSRSEVTKDDAQLTYEVKTDKVPPLLSKVWVILVPEKKG